MKCALGQCGRCQFGPVFVCGDGPVFSYAQVEQLLTVPSLMAATRRKKLAVWKFASCDGCQLSLLDCEDELLALAGEVEIAHFLEASSGVVRGPTISPSSKARSRRRRTRWIQEVRRSSRRLVTIGACATAGGIQALRNFADVQDFMSVVYATPEYVSTLATSRPISAHVPVDYELYGCPINKHQLLEVLSAYLAERRPAIPSYSVCVEQAARQRLRHGRARYALPASSLTPGAARSARRTTAAATAASGRWRARTHHRSSGWSPTSRRLRPRPASPVPDVPRHR